MRISSSQRGDTIIEVLISVAIVGLVLTMSYATASRSLRIGQQAHERVEALKVAEGQVELLKAMVGRPAPNDIFASSSTFCVTSTLAKITQQPITVPVSPTATLNVAPNDTTTSVANPYAPSCTTGVGNRYRISITRVDTSFVGPPARTESTFTIRVRWDRLGGGVDEVPIVYKLHAGQT